MNRVIENIEYLVRRHDFVGVPSLGAFIAYYRPAAYDDNHALFMPPARIVTFNPEINRHEDLLISSLSRRERISYAKAKKMVEEAVDAIKGELADNGEAALGSVGRLVSQPDSAPLFEPSEMLVGYESGFFTPLSVIPIDKEISEEDTVAEAPKRGRRVLRAILRATEVAAALLIFLCVGVAVFVPEIFNRNDCLAMVSSNPIEGVFSSETTDNDVDDASECLLTIADPSSDSETAEEVPAEMVEAETDAIEEIAEQQNVASSGIRLNPSDRYCIVVASMASAALAEKFIREDGNPDLRYYVTDGKYRVYAASAMTQDELYTLKAGSFGERYPNGWVCRMN